MTAVVLVRIALRALGANKLRTGLTMLGMVIGVGSIIALTAIGKGAETQVSKDIQSMGTNLLFVRPGSATAGAVQRGAGTSPTLSMDDSSAIAALTGVAGVAPEVQAGVQLATSSGLNYATRLLGVTDSYASLRNVSVSRGQWIDISQVQGRENVIVLGDTVAQKLFPNGDAVGQTVRAVASGQSGALFRVIGVTRAKGAGGLGDEDDAVFAPLGTVYSRLSAQRTPSGATAISTINVQVQSEDLIDSVSASISALLRGRHRVEPGREDFTVRSQREFVRTLNQVGSTFTLLLTAIAGISLLVGGIGIMNIMLVSITERTREIGIRKAVGADGTQILGQFLVEALVLSVLGGLLGIAAGGGGAGLLANLGLSGLLPVPGTQRGLQPQIGVEAVALAFGVSAFIGLFFGIYPAVRAARLSPIEALRSE